MKRWLIQSLHYLCVTLSHSVCKHEKLSGSRSRESEGESLKHQATAPGALPFAVDGPTFWTVWQRSRLFSGDIGTCFGSEHFYEMKSNLGVKELTVIPPSRTARSRALQAGEGGSVDFSFGVHLFMFININWTVQNDQGVSFTFKYYMCSQLKLAFCDLIVK